MSNITINIGKQRDLILHVGRGTEHRHNERTHRDKTKYRRKEKHRKDHRDDR